MKAKKREATLHNVTERTKYLDQAGMYFPVWMIDDRQAILFDSGLARDRQALTEALEREKIEPRAVVTSHAHIDHTGNHTFLKNRYRTEIWMTALDAALSESVDALALLFPNIGKKEMVNIAGSMLTKADRIIPMRDETITVCDTPIRVLPLPGHTPGHVGFILPDGTAYLGDLLMSDDMMAHTRYPFTISWTTDVESKIRVMHMGLARAVIAHAQVVDDVAALTRRNLIWAHERLSAFLQNIDATLSLTDIERVAFSGQVRRDGAYQALVNESVTRQMVSCLADIDCLRVSYEEGTMLFTPTGKKVPPFLTKNETSFEDDMRVRRAS